METINAFDRNRTGPIPVTASLPRLAGVDLARGLAVIFMVAVHVLMVHGDAALQASPLGILVEFLGGPPAAPVFMFLMGLSFAYANKDDFRGSLRRGLLVLGSGYLLNLLRSVLPLMVVGLIDPALAADFMPEGAGILDLLLIGDILQFAGLALVAMAILHRLGAKGIPLLVLAGLVAGAAPFLWGLRSGLPPLDLALDLLWGDRPLPMPLENAVSFPVFPWLAFPLLGAFLGERLRSAASPAGLIRRAGLVGLLPGLAGLALTLTDPAWHLNDYYHARWGSMLAMTGFVLAWLWLWDLAARSIPDNAAFRLLASFSRLVTPIYFIQWILIDWAIALFGGASLGLAGSGILFLAVTGLSLAGARAFAGLKAAKNGRRAGAAAAGGATRLPPSLRDAGPARETRAAAVRVLAEAFREDPLHRHLFPGEGDRRDRLVALYEHQIDVAGDSCRVSSPAVEGVAIWEGPGRHRSSLSLREILRGLELILRCGPRAVFRMLRYQSWSTRLRLDLVREPYWYLRSLAVDPAHQGKGHASSLLRPFLAAADAAGERVYLETHHAANVALYERYGFRLLKSLPFEKAGVVHHCMRRDPVLRPDRAAVDSITGGS